MTPLLATLALRTAAGAPAMLVLALLGIVLVARRTGGWRRWFAPLHGLLPGRLHVEIARTTALGMDRRCRESG